MGKAPDLDTIINRIQGLLRLQEKATTVAEEANAASKIRAMLLKHNLDMATVENHNKKPEEVPIEHATFDTAPLTKKSEGGWVRDLAGVLAKHNMCRLIGTGYVIGRVHIVGSQLNVKITWYLVEQLVSRLRTMARESFSTYEGKEKRNTYIRGYFHGAVNGISEKLCEEAAREVYHSKQGYSSHTQGIALDETQSKAIALTTMLMKEERKVNDYVDDTFRLTSKSVRRTSSQSGTAIGYRAGKSISINKGLD